MNVLMGARPMLGAGRMVGRAVGFGGFGPLMVIGYVLLVSLIVGLIILAVTRKPRAVTAGTLPAPDAARTIARERLARGEIDPEQYVAIITALGDGPRNEALPEPVSQG